MMLQYRQGKMRTPVALVLGLSLVVIYNVHCTEHNGTVVDPIDEIVEKEVLAETVRQLEQTNNFLTEQLGLLQQTMSDVLKERDMCKETSVNMTKQLQWKYNVTKEQLDHAKKSLREVQHKRDYYKEALEKAQSHPKELKCIIHSETRVPESPSDFNNCTLHQHLEQTISNLSTSLSVVRLEQEHTTSKLKDLEKRIVKLEKSKKHVGSPNCDVNGDCASLTNAHCKDGICRCNLGFAMDGTTCRNLTECFAFSKTMRRYEGHAIWGYNIRTANAQTPESCQQLCIDNPRCKSVDFHITTHKCSISDKTWFDVPVGNRGISDDYYTYQRDCDRWKSPVNNAAFPYCASNEDCASLTNSHCYNDICRCDIGFSIYQEACQRLTECTTFSKTIRRFEGHAIWGYNIAEAEGQRPESCQQLCIDNPNCRSVDFHVYTHKCSMSDKTWFDVPAGSRGTAAEYYSYQRDCDRWSTDAFPNCTANGECSSLSNAHCNNGICRCNIGFSIHQTTCQRLTQCTSFSKIIRGYEGRAIWGYNIAAAEGQSPESCQLLCIDNPNCRSVDFHIYTHKCSLSDKTWFDVPAGSRGTSAEYYSYQRDCDRWRSAVALPDCTTNGDCISLTHAHCNNGNCRCDIGFAIDGTACRRLTECTVLSNTMRQYYGSAIGGHNIATVGGQSLESCQQLCINNANCKTADFDIYSHKCFPSDKTWFEVPVANRVTSEQYYSYQKDCDSWRPLMNNTALPECTTNGDCISLTHAHCNNGSCRCDIGFAVDGTACRRLTECTALSKTISRYYGHAIGGHNIANVGGHSLESCQQLCIENPNCKTVDFDIYTNRCFPSDKTWFEVPVANRVTSEQFYYNQKDCDSWRSTMNNAALPDCTTNADCISLTHAHCNNGNCRCDIGFAVDGTACRRLTECTALSTTISRYYGHAIGGHNIANVGGYSLERCQQLCIENPNCKTVDFDIYTNRCFPSDKTWFEVPVANRVTSEQFYYNQKDCDRWSSVKNNVAFPKCTVNTDCASLTKANCNDGTCRCDIGFSIDGTKCRRLTECSTFLRTIRRYKHRAIWRYNIDFVPKQTPESCQQLCIDNPKCKTVDFHINTHACALSDKTWFDVPQKARGITSVYYHYQKDCDW